MKIIKNLLVTIVFIFSALVASLILTTVVIFGHRYYKLYFTVQPTKQQLELSEALVRSRELVISYWHHHQYCPTSADLTTIQQLGVVANITVEQKLDSAQCVIIINLAGKDLVNKQLKQIIEFTETEDSAVNYSCYHNALKEYLPNSCQSLRDIDLFNKSN